MTTGEFNQLRAGERINCIAQGYGRGTITRVNDNRTLHVSFDNKTMMIARPEQADNFYALVPKPRRQEIAIETVRIPRC